MIDVTTAELAASLIAVFEGMRLTAYQDSGGIWTCGLGHTSGVTAGMTCTPEQAAQWFSEDAAPLFARVATFPELAANPIEAAAFISFGYNCGLGAMSRVLLGSDTIDNPIHTTDRHGNVQPGLVNRRRLESLLVALGQQMVAK